MPRLIRICVLAYVVVALVGCGRRYPEDPRIAQTMDNARCTNYGFTPGSPQFAQCMMQLDLSRTNTEEARRDAATEAVATGLENFGAAMQRPPAYVPPPTPVTTRCQNFGGIVRCSSY